MSTKKALEIVLLAQHRLFSATNEKEKELAQKELEIALAWLEHLEKIEEIKKKQNKNQQF